MDLNNFNKVKYGYVSLCFSDVYLNYGNMQILFSIENMF